jgi:hypothetical protein
LREEVERDLQVLGVRRWRELVIDRNKMEGHFSTCQSPQRAVAPTEEEEEEEEETQPTFSCSIYKIKFLDLIHHLLLKKKHKSWEFRLLSFFQ